jgi:hypothetical protein
LGERGTDGSRANRKGVGGVGGERRGVESETPTNIYLEVPSHQRDEMNNARGRSDFCLWWISS